MTTDLRALMAAVVADPSDDVARLVYADCLEENGGAPRARFIRLQIEAERHHPHELAYEVLESQARALFAEHWIDWWGEVCTAVGLPVPTPHSGGRLGRLASRIGLRAAPGHPYRATGFDVQALSADEPAGARSGFGWVRFHRGFPDELHVGLDKPHFAAGWPRVSPLESLSVAAPYFRDWIDGPHLGGVRELHLSHPDTEVLDGICTSPHCTGLERLHLYNFSDSEFIDTLFIADLTTLLSSARVRQLRELSISLWFEPQAELLAVSEGLAGLTSLRVSLPTQLIIPGQDAGRMLATLAASPHLANLTRLEVASVDAAGIDAVLRGRWTGLRTLELRNIGDEGVFPFARADGLKELDDLRLLGVPLNDAGLSALTRSPLLKRVKHFAVCGSPVDRTTLPKLVAAVDRDRIETFALILPPGEPLREYADTVLRVRFGDRGRLI